MILDMSNLVGVLGASSHVGQAFLPLLVRDGFDVIAFSRRIGHENSGDGEFLELDETKVIWRAISSIDAVCADHSIPYWISLAPIRVLPAYFETFKASGAKRIVALSSTSRFTKQNASDPQDQALAQSFVESEFELQNWAERHGVEFVILRPTLIYGLGKDKNICEIIRLIRKFGFFPLLGEASGLRQPVHCCDVALACQAALISSSAVNKSYNLSGGEVLSYREMVARVFQVLQRKPRFFNMPVGLLRGMMVLLSLIPRYRKWSFAMVERMNQDMVFDHTEAERDLGFKPRGFSLSADDLP